MSGLSKSLSLVSAVALIASAGLSHAADMPVEAAPIYSAVPVANWSGFYAGSLIGYGWSEASDGASDISTDGQTGGAVIGYNWQSGNIVFGLEGDITLHEIRGSDYGTSVDTLYSAHLRGRLGYDAGRFLPYIAGGLASGETYVHETADRFNGSNERMFGWTIGAGVDVKLGETFIGPLILRAEYLYENMSDKAFSFPDNSSFEVGHDTHFARIGVISYLGVDTAPAFTGDAVDWSGAYGGVMVGYSQHNVDSTSGGIAETLEADGAFGGIYTGRNFQFGNFVLGIEGSIALADITGDGLYTNGSDHSYRGNIQGDARGRVGYAFGNLLPFISGGLSWSRSEQILGANTAQRGRVPAVAWTVGAGLDYRLSDRVSLRGEYLYALDDDAKSPDFLGADAQEIESHQVRFGAAYHF